MVGNSFMKKVLIITDVDFWREGAGHRSRIKSLAEYLGEKTILTIIFAGEEVPIDFCILNKNNINYELIYLEKSRRLTIPEYTVKLVEILKDYKPDVCIIEYIHLAFVKEFFSGDTKLILDTHDLASERGITFKNFGYEHEQMTFDDEISVFKWFDKVLMIQKNEYFKVCNHIGKERVLLVPHPAYYPLQTIREKVRKIGFIGSSYMPNKDGIVWFIENIFYHLNSNIELHIYGAVCTFLDSFQGSRIILHGFVQSISSVYSEMDIMINPVRFGAGLKIKNIEALGYGLPLITTPHSASGLTSQINRSFLVADTADDFLKSLNELIENYTMRKNLGKNAHHFMLEHFSPSSCFDLLVEYIYS
jgi:glycosyltransferase involved in cell wall biosynthesis